jgi:peptidoglycan/xylan/chitin deacetylase (PgdA/CDA1 family)
LSITRERIAGLLHRGGLLDLALGVRGRLGAPVVAVLTYHHVAEPDGTYAFDPDVADVTPTQFRHQLELLLRRCTPIGIDDLCNALDGAPLPKNPLLITFDDGYRSNLEVAVPILRELGAKATFFIATAFAGERRLYWWEAIANIVHRARKRDIDLDYPVPTAVDLDAPGAVRKLQGVVKDTIGLDVDRFVRELAAAADAEWTPAYERALAASLIMGWDEIRAVAAAGMDVESHTRSHRVLQTLEPAELVDELAGSRLDLEREIGRPVRAVAYPVGRRIADVPELRHAVARAGYRIGFTNASGVNRLWMGVDAYDVRRLATQRGLSDAMLIAQVAVPQLAYVRHTGTAKYRR